MRLSDFIAKGLEVTFSTPVTSTQTGRGWFIVEAEYPSQSDGTIIVQRVLDARIELGGITATFIPHPNFEPTFKTFAKGLETALVRVVLKGDFVIDLGPKNEAVDADPIADNLKTGIKHLSGTGVPGGDFTSWFFLQS